MIGKDLSEVSEFEYVICRVNKKGGFLETSPLKPATAYRADRVEYCKFVSDVLAPLEALGWQAPHYVQLSLEGF